MSYRHKAQSLTEPKKFGVCISGTAERMERRNESTNGAGTEMRDPAEGDCGFALLPPPEVSIPAEYVP